MWGGDGVGGEEGFDLIKANWMRVRVRVRKSYMRHLLCYAMMQSVSYPSVDTRRVTHVCLRIKTYEISLVVKRALGPFSLNNGVCYGMGGYGVLFLFLLLLTLILLYFCHWPLLADFIEPDAMRCDTLEMYVDR